MQPSPILIEIWTRRLSRKFKSDLANGLFRRLILYLFAKSSDLSFGEESCLGGRLPGTSSKGPLAFRASPDAYNCSLDSFRLTTEVALVLSVLQNL